MWTGQEIPVDTNIQWLETAGAGPVSKAVLDCECESKGKAEGNLQRGWMERFLIV